VARWGQLRREGPEILLHPYQLLHQLQGLEGPSIAREERGHGPSARILLSYDSSQGPRGTDPTLGISIDALWPSGPYLSELLGQAHKAQCVVKKLSSQKPSLTIPGREGKHLIPHVWVSPYC
jgi:hypothetical protein